MIFKLKSEKGLILIILLVNNNFEIPDYFNYIFKISSQYVDQGH